MHVPSCESKEGQTQFWNRSGVGIQGRSLAHFGTPHTNTDSSSLKGLFPLNRAGQRAFLLQECPFRSSHKLHPGDTDEVRQESRITPYRWTAKGWCCFSWLYYTFHWKQDHKDEVQTRHRHTTTLLRPLTEKSLCSILFWKSHRFPRVWRL